MDVSLKVFKVDDNKYNQLEQKPTKGEADFNHLERLKNQLIIAAENFVKGENLSPVVIPTLSWYMDGQPKLDH